MPKLENYVRETKQKLGVVYNYTLNSKSRLVNKYAKLYQENEILPKTILFESRDGQSFTDSPLAMYLFMLNDQRFREYKFYWTYTDKNYQDIENLPKDNRVFFVKRNSDNYLNCLTSCQYLVNNSTFQSFYTKKDEQIYINTWHGTPLKKMGFDISSEVFGARNVLRNLLMTDYFLSPNAYTSKIFRKAYKLDGLYEGEIIEEGYPRIDLTTCRNNRIVDYLAKYGLKIDTSKKIVLYTPTWKGSDFRKARTSIYQLASEVKFIQKELGEEYQVLCKVHPFAYDQVKEANYLQQFLVPDTADANELLKIVDILITDYSSIFFDFLITDKPIIFYCWDKEGYSSERGLYFKEDKLPGPEATNIVEVIEYLKNIEQVKLKFQDNYSKLKQEMCSLQDGNVTKKVVEYIFLNQGEVSKIKVPQKEKLLIYGGALKVNGITEALMSLLDHLDHNKYDVTILTNQEINHHKDEKDAVLDNIKKLVHKYRVLFKFDEPVYSLEEALVDKQVFKNLENQKINYPIAAYQREAKRLTANCHFDVAIDYSGYSYYWAKLIAWSNASKYLIYQHNDMYAEQFKKINGKQVHYQNLQGVFKLYEYFDQIVNVSEAICKINARNLVEYAPNEKFVCAHNLLRIERILNRQEKIKINQRNLSVRNIEQTFKVKNEFLTYYSSLETQEAKKLKLGVNRQITGVMQAYHNQKLYIKFAYEGLIYGWCLQEDLEVAFDQILERRNVNFDAYIKPVKGYWYFDKPYNTEKDIKKIGTLAKLWNVKVHISEEVVTTYDIFWKMTYGNEELGWARQSAFNKIENVQINLVRKIKNYLTAKQKIKKRITAVEEVSISGKITKGKHNLYDQVAGTYRVRIKDNISNKEDTIFYADKLAKTKQETSYYIRTNSKEGWISSKECNDIAQIPIVISEEDVNLANVKFKNAWVILIPNLEDLALNLTDVEIFKYYVNVQKFEGKLAIKRKIYTTLGFLYEIEVDGQKVGYLFEKDLEEIKSEKETSKIKLGDKEIINFINVARMSPEKNQIALVEAIRLLLMNNPEYADKIKIHLVGDGVLKNQVEQLIKEYQLDEQFILYGRLANPYPLMNEADCLIFPSLYEGQGLVLLEALTLEKDIIASDIPTSREVLENGRYGLIADGTDSVSLANAIKEYLVNSQQFDRFDYKRYNQNAVNELIQLL